MELLDKAKIHFDKFAEEWVGTVHSLRGMVGMQAKGGKILDDLAAMGYQIAELPQWVGPTSAELAAMEAQGRSKVGGGTSEVGGGSLQVGHGRSQVPARVVVTQNTPPPGAGS